jgi:pantetheine-phosphate adenylyltransferase
MNAENKMTVAVVPGSFDPLTNGHLDIIRRSAKMVDELVVAVLHNSAKNSLFSSAERVKMIEEMVADLPNVKVESFDGLLVDYMDRIEADIIIRGLRAVTDFEYELQIAQTNHKLSSGEVDTMFLTTALEYAYLSSSGVKEIAKFDGDVSMCVPEHVAKELYRKFEK